MNGGISAPFIRYPIGTSLMMAGILFVGLVAYPLLPVAPLPQVAISAGSVLVLVLLRQLRPHKKPLPAAPFRSRLHRSRRPTFRSI